MRPVEEIARELMLDACAHQGAGYGGTWYKRECRDCIIAVLQAERTSAESDRASAIHAMQQAQEQSGLAWAAATEAGGERDRLREIGANVLLAVDTQGFSLFDAVGQLRAALAPAPEPEKE